MRKVQRLHREMHPSLSLSGLRTNLWHANTDICGTLSSSLQVLVSWELLADDWTLLTKAAFAVLWCYFWIFLIMSQHKFGYIIIMYSGLLVNTSLCSLWIYSSFSYFIQMTHIIGLFPLLRQMTRRWNFISSLGAIVRTIPRCLCVWKSIVCFDRHTWINMHYCHYK